MEMDFDAQLGLEDEHLQSFEEEAFMDAPEESEPIAAEPVVLPEQESTEDDERETMDSSPVRQSSPSPEVEVAQGPPPKRIRLTQKTTAVEISPPRRSHRSEETTVSGSPSPQDPSGCEAEEAKASVKWWEELDHRSKWRWSWNRIAKAGFREYLADQAKKQAGEVIALPNDFGKLNKVDKWDVARHWLVSGSGQFQPKPIKTWILQNFHQKTLGTAAKQKMRSKQLMFTCQGDWGLLKLPADLSPSPDLDTLVEQLREVPDVLKLWARVRKEAARWEARLGAADYTLCLELCTKTWQEEKTVRLHCHLAFAARDRMFMSISETKNELFLGGTFKVTQEAAIKRRCAGWASFYYVQGPKIGHILEWGTKRPYEDYPVSPEWIWGLVQSKKMSFHEARKELVRCAKCLTRHLPNLNKLEEESIALDLQKTIREKEKILQRERCPFKQLKPVQALIEDLKVPRDRRKFLVLDGPSKMGKTAYCMYLFGKDATLEINCMGETSPQMQMFRHNKHKCVLLDEAAPEMVLLNRKLFQAPNSMVQLAQSKTGCHSYSVYLNDALLVISSNHWVEALAQLKRSESAWLEANQVLIQVTRPLWLPGQQPAGS